jgi:BirA family transcriptional regulator, biotin operon repressor / biotin---[acetyl-CoA-carboxylase] ligase
MGPREFHAEIPSTQDRAIELARGGAPEGTRVVALEQTRGRGRLDHRWSSPTGGLYVSIVLRTPAEHLTWLPLALGARLAHEFRERYSVPFSVKWPNDVLWGVPGGPARKVAGILVDRIADGSCPPVEVAGIGVNVTTAPQRLPDEVRGRAASLAEAVQPAPTLEEVETVVVRSALGASTGLQGREGVEATRKLCRERLFGVGRRAAVDGRDSGTIVGLGPDGELLLEQDSERVAIRAGDVRVEGAA